MAATTNEFPKRMRIYGSQLGEAVNSLGASAGIAIGVSLVQDTPIDKGTAKSNWQASRTNPRTGTREAYATGKFGTTESANIAAAINHIVEQFKARRNNQQIFLTNNLYYIGDLENFYGTPKKPRRKNPPPPAKYQRGFVRVALQKGRERIRDTRLIKRALSQVGITGFNIEVR
jgi:hypothetical protein